MSETFARAWLPGVERRAAAANGIGAPSSAPLVAILCAAPRGRAAAAAIALALARVTRRRCALASVVGEAVPGSMGGAPTARRAARGVRERGLPAVASGRLVWLPDHRGAVSADDVAGHAAAMSAELGRAAAFVGAPAAIAMPFARTAALDRVLAWHDALVVVRDPDAAGAVIEHALESLAELGRPVTSIATLPWLPRALAAAGAVAPVEAVRAVVELGLGGVGSGPRDA
jgi:hypothetical protein